MFNFFLVQLIILVADGCCLGLLLCYLIPVDPAALPRTVAWLQANKDPDPDSWMPLMFYRVGTSVMAVIIISWTQYNMLTQCLLFPTWISHEVSDPVRSVVVLSTEVLLFAWTVYVYWEFRRAAHKAK